MMTWLWVILLVGHATAKFSVDSFKTQLSTISSKALHDDQLAKRNQFSARLAAAVSNVQTKERLKDVVKVVKSVATPVVLLHGLNEDGRSLSVLSRWIRYALPGTYVHVLELGDRFDTFFTNMNRQVAAACELLSRNPRLQHGFHIIGLGQGALLGRGYVERCNQPPVITYISLGGPQAGVFQMPAIHDEHADFVLQGGAYEEWSQEYLAPSQYFRHPMKPNLHERESSFLADINNDRPVKNATYRRNIESLSAMVLVKFSNDHVIVPRESSWFGYYKALSVDEVIPMEETELFLGDHIGLQRLRDDGRLHLIECPGDHQEFSRGWFYEQILPFLNTTLAVELAPNNLPHSEL